MVNNKVSAPERVISAILFLLVGLFYLAVTVANFSVWTLLLILPFLFLAVTLFIRSRDILPVVALALLTLLAVIIFFRGFFTHAYSSVIYSYSYRYRYESSIEYRFHLITLLPSLLHILSWVTLTLLAAVNFLNLGGKGLNRLWYIPALLMFLSGLFNLLFTLLIRGWSPDLLGTITMVLSIPLTEAFLFGALWFIGEEPEGYYPIAKHIAMTIFTLGLWYPVWVWHLTRHLNKVENVETRRPTACLLLCIFLPFYAFYWNYVSAQRIDRLAKDSGVESKLDVLCLLLSLVIPFLPSIIMQEKINRITLVNNTVFTPDFPPAASVVPAEETPAEPAAPYVNPQQTPVYDASLPEL